MFIYNNFSFWLISDYFFVGGEGCVKICEGVVKLFLFFSIMCNSVWYKKCI